MIEGSLGLVGAGSLAWALAQGLASSGLPTERMWVCNRTGTGLERFDLLGMHTTALKAPLAGACTTLVLLMKPRDALAALAELRPHVRSRHRILSCVAGLGTAAIDNALGGGTRVVRAMPNVAAEIGASITAVAPGAHADAEDVQAAMALLASLGPVVQVLETELDAVTAVAGSGPAYFFLLMELLIDAAVQMGLERHLAERLVRQTALGAARLVAETERTPQALRISVTSPGGTTEAALARLAEGGLGPLMTEAVERATERGRELGRRWSTPSAG